MLKLKGGKGMLKKRKAIVSAILSVMLILVLAIPALADTPGIRGPLVLIADDANHTYLGQLTANEYAKDSVFNEYGTYGSEYAINSTTNVYGLYGGKYSIYSPFNEFTISPPIIVDADGDIVGRLSANKAVVGAVSPYSIFDLLTRLGL